MADAATIDGVIPNSTSSVSRDGSRSYAEYTSSISASGARLLDPIGLGS